ncbi:ead/Ea22-like family protein [Enterobacter roggenkampii]|uniref:ead/Ea22-like family protein n=1 Tax=Enterobacter roggenkampii TaxID=1812935 RepID=UPI001C70AD3F|nr:ead/Ea22-like family protein [Enterobacter roggenkampii]MBW9467178.1 ead/Ea22-like family protein [Enterobacter roggenkampii]
MSNIDKRALREAAEKSISEEGETWWNEDQLASDYGLALHRADATFIATSSPATMLALLDELEAKDKRIAELEARTLVPVEPTLDQLVAGKRRLTSTGRMSRLMSQRLAEVYRAMVSAAAAGKGEAL